MGNKGGKESRNNKNEYVKEKVREREKKKEKYIEEDRLYIEYTKKPVSTWRLFHARL